MLTIALACGGEKSASAPAAPAGATVDPATAGTLTASVSFEGEVPKADPIIITGDPKCVAENGAPQRASETLLVDGGVLSTGSRVARAMDPHGVTTRYTGFNEGTTGRSTSSRRITPKVEG